MKHKFTKLMAIIAVLLNGMNLNAASYIPTVTKTFTTNTTVYCTDTDISNAPSSPNETSWVVIPSKGTSSLTYTNTNGDADGNPNSITDNLPTTSSVAMIQIKADGGVYNSSKRVIHMRVKGITGFIAHGATTQPSRGMQVSANIAAGLTETSPMNVVASVTRSTSGSFITSYSSLTASETYVLSIYAVAGDTRFYAIEFIAPPAAPSITKFVAEGVEATINENAKTITAELPYGTSLTSIEPVVTIGGTATGYSPTGAQDFTSPVTYTATDGTNNVNYTVTLTVNATPSSDKDLSDVTIGGVTPTFDAGTNTYSVMLPKASSLTQAVTFTKPLTATADFTSGNTHDFTNPLQITVTAQDASTKVYTLTAQAGIADIAYVSTAATPHANDTKIYPMLLEKGYYVNVIAASGTDLTQFNPYDLVVLCENVSSSNTLALAMNGLIKSKRFLNFKAFMYNKTGWPTGTPSDGSSDADIAIATDYISHPIFSGVSISGNIANILTDPAVKGVQGVLNPASSSVIANLTSTGNTDKVAIIENNQIPTAKYMLIPIQTDSYSKVNANGLKLIENAITYLLTDSKFGPYTGSANINKTNIIFDGRTIQNPDRQQLHVFDATGRLLLTSREDINMSAQAKGVYLVKGENGMMKIALTK